MSNSPSPRNFARWQMACLLLCLLAAASRAAGAVVVFEATSPYHHIRVIDETGIRTLSFDGSMETRMSLLDPLKGHFEYTEYFHMPWLWHGQMTNVLMIGLGAASTPRAYQYYYTNVMVEVVEIDPLVVQVAKEFFHLKESPTLQVRLADGRVFLRRSQTKYGAILMDAYVKNRYGSFIPYHLATKEFFALANDHLTDDGALAYNVIGTRHGFRADILGAVYETMKTIFPQVYFFPAADSQNVVLIGTKSRQTATLASLQLRATDLIQQGRIKMPTFRARLLWFRADPPSAFSRSPVLTDDFAPTDGVLSIAK